MQAVTGPIGSGPVRAPSPRPMQCLVQTGSHVPSPRVQHRALSPSPVRTVVAPTGGGAVPQVSWQPPVMPSNSPGFAWQMPQGQRMPSEPVVGMPSLQIIPGADPRMSGQQSHSLASSSRTVAAPIHGQQPINGGAAAAALMGLLPYPGRVVVGGPVIWPAAGPRDIDLSSIPPPLSPTDSNRADKEDVLEQCRDTTKLVTQLASVIRGLESDVDSLRRENRNLRKTVSANQVELTKQAMPTTTGTSPVGAGASASSGPASHQQSKPAGEAVVAGQPAPAAPTHAVVPSRFSGMLHIPQVQLAAAMQAAQKPTTSPDGSLQSLSSVPPTARLMQVVGVPRDRAGSGGPPQSSGMQQGPASPRTMRNLVSGAPPMSANGLPCTPSPKARGTAPRVSQATASIGAASSLGEVAASPTSIRTDPSTNAEITSTLMASQQEFGQPEVSRIIRDGMDSAMSPNPTSSIAASSVAQLQFGFEGANISGNAAGPRRISADRSNTMQQPVVMSEATIAAPSVFPPSTPAVQARSASTSQPASDQGAQPASASEVNPKELLSQLEELASRGEAAKVEEILIQHLHAGLHPSEACYDVVIAALSHSGDTTRAQEWLRQMIESGMVPSETSFNTIVLAACDEGVAQTVEELMMTMIRMRLRPGKDIFDAVLRLFSHRRDSAKVEEWLLNAGQSGWTPEQYAFEAAVLLFAETDGGKADEWLSRAQQTEYKLSDACFCAVIRAFNRVGRVDKATDRLSRMIQDGRSPTEETIREVVGALADAGDVPLAEAWLAQLTGRSGEGIDDLRRVLFDASMRTNDVACAEQQLALISSPDADRTQKLAEVLAESGDPERARAVLQSYVALGGPPSPEITTSLLSVCASLNDSSGAEAAAIAFAAVAELNDLHLSLLRHAVGDLRTEAIVLEQSFASGHPLSTDDGSELMADVQSNATSNARERLSVASTTSTGMRVPASRTSASKRSSTVSMVPTMTGPGAAIAAARQAAAAKGASASKIPAARRAATGAASGTRGSSVR